MKRAFLTLILLGLIAAGVLWVVSSARPVFDRNAATLESGGDAARGKLVFHAGGCASCHMT
ncbi:MAG: hypothetical protein JNK46_01285, partial [Methylobacteriaceae bacterium]|nr:hypothetical protein [Methylobacteriaceae bacterium]